MTDERRVEVAAEALRADGWTCEYHEPTARRGECSGCDATLDASARAVVAALDAHDGDLRHPNGLRYVNPRGDGPSDAERHPSSRPLAEVRAELARITADTTGDRP